MQAPFESTYCFGVFRLTPAGKELVEGDRPVRIAGRAFELLVALVERAGEVVGKSELANRVWPDVAVEDGSLRACVAILRKTLGEGQEGRRYISNVAGRGYCFVAEVRQERVLRAAETLRAAAVHPTNLSPSLTRLVGRADSLEAISAHVMQHRLVCIVGPGGVGKTALALAVAEGMLRKFVHGVWVVDLSSVSHIDKISSVLAAVLEAPSGAAESLTELAAYLRNRRAVLVFDNCEHMLEPVAAAAYEILRQATGIHILATSREPLRTAGEFVQRLRPLEFPGEDVVPSPLRALEFPAIQLFVERAMSSADSFELGDGNVDGVIEICRRLDGIPLALELAAAQVGAHGVRGLLMQLEGRFTSLPNARGDAPDRHRTLGSLIGWSYELLPQLHQVLLRRLAVFSGNFSMGDAIAVAGFDPLDERGVVAGVARLTSQSLLTTDAAGDDFSYRMLFGTRAFALDLLGRDPGRRAASRRHADNVTEALARADAAAAQLSRSEWMAVHARAIDDVRAALAWAFSDDGDLSAGVRLTSAAASLAFHLSLFDEFRRRFELAIAHLGEIPRLPAASLMRLHGALATLSACSIGYTKQMLEEYERGLQAVEGLGDASEIEALNGVFIAMQVAGRHRSAEDYALRVAAIASSSDDATLSMTADRMLAVSGHHLGHHRNVAALIERLLSQQARARSHAPPFPIDPRLSLRILSARILWIEGRVDEAMSLAVDLAAAAAKEPGNALAIVIGWAVFPIALWRGDLEQAREFSEAMRRHANELGMRNWCSMAENFTAVLRSCERRSRGELGTESTPIRVDVEDGLQRDLLRTLDDGVEDIDSLRRVQEGEVGWCAPEILRRRGVELIDADDDAAGALLLQEALVRARRDGALSWELRAATSLAHMLSGKGESDSARDLLFETYSKFTQGFGTRDLVAARGLLGQLNQRSER